LCGFWAEIKKSGLVGDFWSFGAYWVYWNYWDFGFFVVLALAGIWLLVGVWQQEQGARKNAKIWKNCDRKQEKRKRSPFSLQPQSALQIQALYLYMGKIIGKMF